MNDWKQFSLSQKLKLCFVDSTIKESTSSTAFNGFLGSEISYKGDFKLNSKGESVIKECYYRQEMKKYGINIDEKIG
jgi:hypothetical protein